jgi:hypothetical protein
MWSKRIVSWLTVLTVVGATLILTAPAVANADGGGPGTAMRGVTHDRFS